MHWEIWDRQTANLIEEFDSEEEAMQAVREMLAVNSLGLVDELSVGATYDEGEPPDVELPTSLYGETLKARLAEMAQSEVAEAAHKVYKQIKAWLTEDSWIVRDCSDRPGDFALQAMHVAGFIVHISQPREHLDHLTIRTEWGHDESIKELIDSLPGATVQDVVWNSFRDATIMGVDFGGFKFPKDVISTSVPLYYDALTKDVLFQRILLVDRALTLTIRAFRRALEAQRQSDQTALTEEQLAKITPLAWRSDQSSTRAS